MVAQLAAYNKKRNFHVTAEPKGAEPEGAEPKGAEPKGRTQRGRGSSFVIQKHDATRLHYDFRLEVDGVLKSWAVPKGPSLDPTLKRLAVEVEDHPLSYASFEGTIPAHQYGAGDVIVWDRGTWKSEGDVHKALAAGRLHFTLNGEKLHGAWNLVRTQKNGGKKNWLLFKARDDEARPESEYDITDALPESVMTGEPLGGRKKNGRASSPGKKVARKRAKPAAKQVAERPTADPLPEFIAPELATLVKEPPTESYFLVEHKFDGYRAMARLDHGKVIIHTRNENDWTSKFKSIAKALAGFAVDSAYLDGEVVAFGEKGQNDFQALQNSFDAQTDTPLYYCVFDLLYLNGHDIRELPLVQRKQLLKTLLEKNPHERIRYSEHTAGNARKSLQRACSRHLEGIICKDGRQPYVSGRSADWVKVKCINRQEFVIVGYSAPKGTRLHFGALLFGAHDQSGGLRYVGRVGTGFTYESLAELQARLVKLQADEPPVYDPPSARDITWVRPELVCECQFGHFTQDKLLRQPVFMGLREDKQPEQVGIEVPARLLELDKKRRPARPAKKDPPNEKKAAEVAIAAEVELSHPNKVLFPPDGPTKQELAEYYEKVAQRMWPYVEGRPLALLRCPQGHQKTCFFQKHVDNEGVEPGLAAVAVAEKSRTTLYRYLASPLGLRSLVQLGSLELHVWGAREANLERPCELVFDLDPGPDVGWKQVVNAAGQLRELLDRLGLKSFPKLTGGKGLHLHVPIAPRYTFEQAKRFCQAVAKQLEQQAPELYVTQAAKARRGGKIYLDVLRNQRGAHYIAPLSARARSDAPIAAPITWEALSARLLPNAYTVRTIDKYLKAYPRDPWTRYAKLAQHIKLLD